MSEHKPMTPEQIFENDAIMECNAHIGAPMAELVRLVRAIEAATAAPLLEQIAALEQRNSDLYADVQRFREHALNEKSVRMSLEAELAGVKKDADRYRWLRHGDNDEHVIKRGPVASDYVYLLRNEKLDAAIDAMKDKP